MTRMTHAATSLLIALLTVGLSGCDGPADGKTDEGTADDSAGPDTYVQPTDADGDGVVEAEDCNDTDASLYPGRSEDCDGLDNNCNGVIDEGLPDADTDGTADCMDVEECDGVDNDGDLEVDEGYDDGDADGVADCVGTEICDGLDNNEDGRVDEGFDADGDGATQCGSSTAVADCDDTDAAIGPGTSEAAGDLVDNDCDGLVDEGEWAEGDLAITEIMANPAQMSDPEGEWFEVYNTTNRALILNGLILSSLEDEDHMVSSSHLVILEPGEFFVFGQNDNMSTNGGVSVGYSYGQFVLSNESDDLTLIADGIVIDTVDWDDGVTMPDPDGASIGVDLGNYSAYTNDDDTIWCASIIRWSDDPSADKGSPGAGNEFCSTYDHDGDGYNADQGDCADDDATTYPDAWEGTDPIDNDCDGVAETAPVASATATSSGYACDDISLSSAGSYDIEGASLTYAWSLTSAPGASTTTTADLETSTSANPMFNPDIGGTYVFSLTVNDGGTDSASVSVSVSVVPRETNSRPVSVASADQTYSETSTCTAISYGTAYSCDDCSSYEFTLDGSASTDADGDDLTYLWTVTSGGTYGTLGATTGESVALTVSGLAATYGSTNSQQVDVSLEVTDCMAATSTAYTRVTYSCTGS